VGERLCAKPTVKAIVVLTLKGSDNENGRALSGSDIFSLILPWASRKAARPRLLNLVLPGPK